MKKEHIKLINDFETWLNIKNYKPRGIEEKIRKLKMFISYIEENKLNIFSLTAKDALRFREYLKTKRSQSTGLPFIPKTINDLIINTRLFYKYLLLNDCVLTNPFLNIENIKEARRIPRNILSIKQMGKLLDGIDVETENDLLIKILFETLYATGCRISEVVNLKVKDVNLRSGVIKINDDKTRKDRIAVLNDYCCDLLELFINEKKLNDDDRIFNHGNGRTLNGYANRRLKALTKKLKLPRISCHSIRHITATHLLKSGADIREVQEVMGHRHIDSTDVYTKIFPDDLKSVVEKKHPRERKKYSQEPLSPSDSSPKTGERVYSNKSDL